MVICIVYIVIHSFRTKKRLESHKKVCENKDFWTVIMPSEDTKILELNQYQKSDKVQFITYGDLECIIETLMNVKNNSENSSTTNVANIS